MTISEYDYISPVVENKVVVKKHNDYGLYDLKLKQFIIPLGKYVWLSDIHPETGYIRCIEESIVDNKSIKRMGILAIDGQVVLPAIAYRIWDFIHNADDYVRMEWGGYSQEISLEEMREIYGKKFSIDTVEKLCERSVRYYDTDMWEKENIFMHLDVESLEDEEVEVPEDVYEYEDIENGELDNHLYVAAEDYDSEDDLYDSDSEDEEEYEYDYEEYDPEQWDGDYEAYVEEYGE